MNLPIALGMPGWPEIVFILVIVVLLFGARSFPSSLNRSELGGVQEGSRCIERELRKSVADLEVKEPPEKQPHQPS